MSLYRAKPPFTYSGNQRITQRLTTLLSAQADGQRPVGIGSTRAERPMVSGNEVHLCGWSFAAIAFKPLQHFHEGSVAVA